MACRFVINLETKHKLSQTATNSVIESTRENIKEAVLSFRSKVREELRKQHLPEEFLANIPIEDNFEVLSTQKKRNTYYRTKLGLVEPHGVVLWNERRIGPDKRHIGYIPFKPNLQNFLSQSEVWHSVNNPHRSDGNMMNDLCDGDYIKTHPLFLAHPNALQIILHCDDIEIVNPIGSHTKKHKLSMFYYTLGNIPPHLRSNLNAIQLIAVAKSCDLRKESQCVGKLLRDFIKSVTDLSTGGVLFTIDGIQYRLHGTLILVSCDALAASWLGGFKESAHFAYRGCRTCEATAADMHSNF